MNIKELFSPNRDSRPCDIDMLVLHYTGMQSCTAAIERLSDPAAKVSSHYVIDEDGTTYCLVPEEQRAFHAGVSFWRGRRMLNDPSIGIEIVNPGHEWGYQPFPDAQMRAVRDLCLGILKRHAIPAWNVVGHSDIAPTRKQDPGELFDWKELAADGIGVWPDEDADALSDLGAILRHIGYEFGNAADITAFSRHWKPETVADVDAPGICERALAVLRAASIVRLNT